MDQNLNGRTGGPRGLPPGQMPVWLVGFPLKSLDQVIMDIKQAGWPKEYILHPIQFMLLVNEIQSAMPNARVVERAEGTGYAHIFLGNTKVRCAEPEDRTVDVSGEAERRIVAP